MTELVLNAIINLFAAQASAVSPAERATVRASLHRYLQGHLRLWNVADYLELFDVALDLQEMLEPDARLAKAAEVALPLQAEMPRLEQYLFLLHYLQPVAELHAAGLAQSLVECAAASLAVDLDQIEALQLLCEVPFPSRRASAAFLIKDDVQHDPAGEQLGSARLQRPDFQGTFTVLRLTQVNVLLVSANGGAPVWLDAVPLQPGQPQLLSPGAILIDSRGNRLYYGEIAAALNAHGQAPHEGVPFRFQGQALDFRYPASDNGLHDFSFELTGGMMVGVMGVSGAGKSTLLSILNGQTKPDSGRLLINGLDLHRQPAALEGVVGFVPQDDLLFGELSVFDNLYYNASLCMAQLGPEQRQARVEALLDELQQLSIRDLKVGTPLEKTISGGQRKRLNIALELIREPAVLFVDEPTSGLSSSDSENVMALLKAQAAKGKLVIVVIHQPSSRIFKMFDRLWIMDRGGRPIYDGNPLDAIVHFRSQVLQAGMDEYACPSCGNVNPEQLFEIIEARALGPDGRYSRERRVTPQQWHERYQEHRQKLVAAAAATAPAEGSQVERRLSRPGWFGQLGVFFLRTLKGRLANQQYMLVNLLEPPVLALLVALICRGVQGGAYSYVDNKSISTYFFISVIVALFLGMSVSAEEINRDQTILKREAFLHLSWSGYISAKTLYLVAVVALQMGLFVLVGNSVLRIPNLYGATWLVLFSCAAAACLVGLNISAAFRSAVTIYILIPLLLVPQMMLGGAVVDLDNLLNRTAGHRNTPVVADLMPSRWGYEALVVHQYLSNAYTAQFLPWLLEEKQNDYLLNYHLPEVRSLADFPVLQDSSASGEAVEQRLAALRHEVRHLEGLSGIASNLAWPDLVPAAYDSAQRNSVKAWLQQVAGVLRARRRAAWDRRRTTEQQLQQQLGGAGVDAYRGKHFNQEIADLVMNLPALEYVRLSGDRLVQVAAPIAKAPESQLGAAPLFSAHKRLGAWTLPTYAFNLLVLWLCAVVLFVGLYMRLLPRLFAGCRVLGARIYALARRRANA